MKFLAYIFLFFVVKVSFAQSFKASLSEVFPDNIGKPVLLMNDGSTVFQYDNVKDRKMYITIFDKNHQAIVNNKEVDFKTIKYVLHFSYQRSSNVRCWKEQGNQLLIYMTSEEAPYRVSIDPKTGNINKEEPVEYEEYKKAGIELKSNTVNFGIVEFKKLNKEEALARTNFSDISSILLEVLNPDGKVIHKVPYDFVNHKYQHAEFMESFVENDVVYFVSKNIKIYDRASYDKARNMGNGYGAPPEGVICFSKYDIKTQKFSHKEMYEMKPDANFENCKTLYSANSTMFDIRFIVKTASKQGQVFYEIFFQPVNVSDMTLKNAFYLPSEKLDEFVKANCKLDEGYRGGMLDKCLLDKQGNLFVTKVKNVTSYSNFSTGYIYTQNPELIGLSYFDKEGKEIYGVAYPYNTNGSANPNSMTGSVEISKNDFSYVVGNGSKSNLLLLNNLSDNFNLPLNKKPDYAKSLEDCNAMVIEVANDGSMKQSYLFGAPQDKKSNKYVDFANILFDKNTNTYVVKTYDGPGYKKTRAAWIKIE